MAQPSIATFFNTRKRAAAEDAILMKNRRLVEPAEASQHGATVTTEDTPSTPTSQQPNDEIAMLKAAIHGVRTRSGRTVKRIGVQETEAAVPKKTAKLQPQTPQQQKLVQFMKMTKQATQPQTTEVAAEMQRANEETPSSQAAPFSSKSNVNNIERGMRTPTKQIIKGATPIKPAQVVGTGELKSLVRKELKFDEVKTKISRSAKLSELKASLTRIQELEKTRKAQEERNRLLREGLASPAKKQPVVQLKEFDKIELEVLTSPSKTFKTPTKLPPPTPDKNELMSPRHTNVSKRVLFSPAKHGSPSKMIVPPAYQRFQSMAETSKAGQLTLPFKYRNLIEVFKGLDSVCAMFHNRKECITFKKLKPAVQRMLRKNFTESHLAQIKHLYPEAFIFTQMKMRNYGSASKADYFQLVVTPNVENVPEKHKMSKIDEDNVMESGQTTAMNPHVMTERLQRFQQLLLQRVLNEHDAFLRSLDPPLSIPKEKVTRWHPEFDLEKCSDIELGHLPLPPNVEKYSSARDILSTARNLFNCATPMERAMERYEAKLESDRKESEERETNAEKTAKEANPSKVGKSAAKLDAPQTPKPAEAAPAPVADATATLLKGVPKSLLEKIRAKQAAKALDAMTRRPSQDEEAIKFARLPDLARHLRNVFVTERKGVLTLEIVIKKIQNSYRQCLTPQQLEAHLKMIAKEVPAWVAFHEVRKTMYLKISKDMDLAKVIAKLEAVANEKSK